LWKPSGAEASAALTDAQKTALYFAFNVIKNGSL
jgi:hypothetical protein